MPPASTLTMPLAGAPAAREAGLKEIRLHRPRSTVESLEAVRTAGGQTPSAPVERLVRAEQERSA